MMIDVSETFCNLTLTYQCVELATCFLGLVVLIMNVLCIVQLVRQRGFCLLHTMTATSSHTAMTSLFGSNCLIGGTALVKEILLIFVKNAASKSNNRTTTVLAAWRHFEWYVVTFFLASSSLHIFLITATHLLKSLLMSFCHHQSKSNNTAPQGAISAPTRILDVVFVILIWILSLSPAYLQTDDPLDYRQLLNAVSLMLLTCCCVQCVLLVLINWQHRHYKQHLKQQKHQNKLNKYSSKSTSLSSSPVSNDGSDSVVSVQRNYRSNLVRTSRRWSRLKQRQRTICVWLMASYLVASCPYMIYYPVLSKVYTSRPQQRHQPDIIDSVLFLFVLSKCFFDALVFVVYKGWQRDRLKVNFNFDETKCKSPTATTTTSPQTKITTTTESFSNRRSHKETLNCENKNSSSQRQQYGRHLGNGSGRNADMSHVIVDSVVIDGIEQTILPSSSRTTNV